jgi:hypothetical protein
MKTMSTPLRIFSMLSMLAATTTAMAQPGTGILLSDFMVLKPSATFTVSRSDNANLTARSRGEFVAGTLSDPQPDTHFTQGVALDLSNRGGILPLKGRAWWNNQTYDRFDQLDHETYGVGVNTLLGGHKTTLTIAADYQHSVNASQVFDGVNDTLIPEVQTLSQRSERDEYHANARLTRKITDKTDASVSYSYKVTDFNDTTFRKTTEQNVTGRIVRKITQVLKVYAEVGSTHIDQEKSTAEDLEYFNGWEDPYFNLGINADQPFELTDKISFNLSAGYVTRSRVAQDGTRSTDEEATLALNGNLVYVVTPKTTFTLSVRNGLESDFIPGSSLRETTSVNVRLSNQLTDRVSHYITTGWRNHDFFDPLPTTSGLVDEEKDTMIYTYSITYTTLQPWLSIFGTVSYEDGTSNIRDESYDETLLTAGVSLSY